MEIKDGGLNEKRCKASLYEVSNKVKLTEAQTRMMAARGWEGERAAAN